MNETVWYHGGVPGKQPGDLIFPATHMGLDYTAAYFLIAGALPQKPKYRPDRVYFTTHLGVARGYATRYRDRHGRAVSGDVYRVVVAGAIETDPDFDHPKTAGIYGASEQPATIEAVVERTVALTVREQNEAAWPYRFFYDRWQDIHAEDGTVLASAEMRDLGATDEYLRLLPKWMDASEFANGGGLWSPGLPGRWASPDEVLDILAHLDLDTGPHVMTNENVRLAPYVERGSNTRIVLGYFQCRECGATFGGPASRVDKQVLFDAAVHQAGSDLAVVAHFNGKHGDLGGYVHALSGRSPDRWMWLSLPDSTHAKQLAAEYEMFRDQVDRHIQELDESNLGRLEEKFRSVRMALHAVIDSLHAV